MRKVISYVVAFTMAAVIVAACLVYNFVKAYTKKK